MSMVRLVQTPSLLAYYCPNRYCQPLTASPLVTHAVQSWMLQQQTRHSEVFERLLAVNLPTFHRQWAAVALPHHAYLHSWLMTWFTSILPSFIAVRLWDAILLHGELHLLRIATAICCLLLPPEASQPVSAASLSAMPAPDRVLRLFCLGPVVAGLGDGQCHGVLAAMIMCIQTPPDVAAMFEYDD
jgi:hypothetical protein